MARERKKFDDELATRPTNEQHKELVDKLKSLADEREEQGKSDIEKIELKHAREREKADAAVVALEQSLAERDASIATAAQTLRDERMARTFGDALAGADVFKGATGDALAVLVREVSEVEIDDTGRIRASYGDKLNDATPLEIAKQFLADRPHFAQGPAGGAGTKPPSWRGSSKQMHELSLDELTRVAEQAENQKR